VDLHVCLACRLYDPSAHHECRESQAEWVRDKERSNRCEYFELKASTEAKGVHPAEDARKKLDDLFRK